jgi:hypothetical protein
MAKTELPRWHSGIDIGQESGLLKIASALLNGTALQQSRASIALALSYSLLTFEQLWPDIYLGHLEDVRFH